MILYPQEKWEILILCHAARTKQGQMPKNIIRGKTASKISISSIADLYDFKKEHKNTNALYVEDVNDQMTNPIPNYNKMIIFQIIS